jgi:hypothetical protein
MKSCAVQRVVLGIFRGLMTDFADLDLPLLMGLGGETLAGFLMARVTLAIFADTDLFFDFSDVDAADLDTDADGRAMVNSFLKW